MNGTYDGNEDGYTDGYIDGSEEDEMRVVGFSITPTIDGIINKNEWISGNAYMVDYDMNVYNNNDKKDGSNYISVGRDNDYVYIGLDFATDYAEDMSNNWLAIGLQPDTTVNFSSISSFNQLLNGGSEMYTYNTEDLGTPSINTPYYPCYNNTIQNVRIHNGMIDTTYDDILVDGSQSYMITHEWNEGIETYEDINEKALLLSPTNISTQPFTTTYNAMINMTIDMTDVGNIIDPYGVYKPLRIVPVIHERTLYGESFSDDYIENISRSLYINDYLRNDGVFNSSNILDSSLNVIYNMTFDASTEDDAFFIVNGFYIEYEKIRDVCSYEDLYQTQSINNVEIAFGFDSSPKNAIPHRMVELALPLNELYGVKLNGNIGVFVQTNFLRFDTDWSIIDIPPSVWFGYTHGFMYDSTDYMSFSMRIES